MKELVLNNIPKDDTDLREYKGAWFRIGRGWYDVMKGDIILSEGDCIEVEMCNLLKKSRIPSIMERNPGLKIVVLPSRGRTKRLVDYLLIKSGIAYYVCGVVSRYYNKSNKKIWERIYYKAAFKIVCFSHYLQNSDEEVAEYRRISKEVRELEKRLFASNEP